MKKLSKLKLNFLNEQSLEQKQMNELRGGQTCYCSCYWEGNSGSSTGDNMGSNYGSGSSSQHGCNQYRIVDGYVQYCPSCTG